MKDQNLYKRESSEGIAIYGQTHVYSGTSH